MAHLGGGMGEPIEQEDPCDECRKRLTALTAELGEGHVCPIDGTYETLWSCFCEEQGKIWGVAAWANL